MFHTISDGYELVWECGRFDDNEESANEETNRDYSEFSAKTRFVFEELANSSKLISGSGKAQMYRRSSMAPKRSTSTGESSKNNRSGSDL